MIPEAAVEAAAKAMHERERGTFTAWEDVAKPTRRQYMSDARFTLEAAAPHLIQAAKAEAWEEGAIDGQWNAEHAYQIDAGTRQVIPNPYR